MHPLLRGSKLEEVVLRYVATDCSQVLDDITSIRLNLTQMFNASHFLRSPIHHT
jgi:hypothetical protein